MNATPEVGSPICRVPALFEDGDLLAVDKPAGLVAHPAYRHPDGTLDDWVKAYARGQGGGPVWLLHRLDRDTSGVVLYAKSERARRHVVRQFERRQVRKGYLALVAGHFGEAEREVCQPLRRDPADRRRTIVDASGQPAATRFIPLRADAERSLVFCRPVTGRTHQIRVHLAWLGHPILGDAVYAAAPVPGASGCLRQMLHALVVGVRHPATGEPLSIWAPPPADLRAALPAGWLERCDRARLVACGAWETP